MIEFRVPLSVIIAFLERKYGNPKALVDVVFEGEDLMFFFGEKLPNEGTIIAMGLEFPFTVNPQELRPFVKENSELGE